jgi:hypothetical protein
MYIIFTTLGPIYPSPSELVNAPSVCLNDLLSFATKAAPAISSYIKGNFSSYCKQNCYYDDYLPSAIDLFSGQCLTELTNAKGYCPLTYGVSGFQELRGTECGISLFFFALYTS